MEGTGKSILSDVDLRAKRAGKSQRQLAADNDELRARLQEADETLRAIRSGEVDALVVTSADGERIFTLQGADRSYRALVEEMNEGALNLTADGMILYANRKFATLLRASLNEVIGSDIQAWISPESRGALEALLRDGSQVRCRNEVVLAASDGSRVPAYLSINPVSLDGAPATLGVVATDLTEQKAAEQALRLSEAKFRNVFENPALGKALRGLNGELSVNKAFCEILGYSEMELQQLTSEEITHPDDLQVTADARQRLLDGTEPSARFEKRYLHKDGSLIWADVTMGLIRDEGGRPLYFITAINDITARKHADAALLDLKEHLQHHIEMERLRLAQELHDVPLQELYGVIYDLQELRERSDADQSLVLGQVLENIKKTLSSLRSTASELRPPALSRFGLEKAIRSYVEDFRERNPGILVRQYLARDGQILPEAVRLVLFRVLQESLANIVRHAEASEVEVRFSFNEEQAQLEITDNGKGFPLPGDWVKMVRAGHYGLAGMAERLNTAGGTFDIQSAPGRPTTVRAVMPIARHDA